MNATSAVPAKRKYTPRTKTKRACEWCDAPYDSCVTQARFCSTKCKDRSRYATSRSERLEAVRKYRSNNPALIKAQAAAWRAANKEKSAASNRAQYLKNREARIAYAAEYQQTHPWVVALTRNRRRSAEQDDVSGRDLKRLLDRHRNCCAYCSVPLGEWGRAAPSSLQWDHVLPLSRGGRHSVGNILPACRACNASKAAKLLIAWKKQK